MRCGHKQCTGNHSARSNGRLLKYSERCPTYNKKTNDNKTHWRRTTAKGFMHEVRRIAVRRTP